MGLLTKRKPSDCASILKQVILGVATSITIDLSQLHITPVPCMEEPDVGHLVSAVIEEERVSVVRRQFIHVKRLAR